MSSFLGLAAFAAVLAAAGPAERVAVERRVASMGTLFGLEVVGGSREQALAASEQAISEVRRVEDLLTTWRDSPLRRLDDAPVGTPVPLDPELFDLLESIFGWADRTGRAFDPAIAPLVRAWDLRGKGRRPSAQELARAVEATGPDRIRLDRLHRTASRLDALAGIEEGAWGKGYALDRAAERLRASGASALLDLGGQVAGRGWNRDGRRWAVGIADPRRRDREVVTVEVADVSVATSANSQRSLSVGGTRVGHLIDPRTGRAAADFGSVTVVSPSALQADILSTALFVLGPDAGLALAERLRRNGFAVEVLYLLVREVSATTATSRLEARFSPGFPGLVLSMDHSAVRGLPIHNPS